MFCKRKYIMDIGNREHVKRVNALLLKKKYQFVVGEGDDTLKGWCEEASVDEEDFLVLKGVILDLGKTESRGSTRSTPRSASSIRLLPPSSTRGGRREETAGRSRSRNIGPFPHTRTSFLHTGFLKAKNALSAGVPLPAGYRKRSVPSSDRPHGTWP